MGNGISVQEDTENQENEFSADDNDAKHASEPKSLQNGPVTIQNVQTISLQSNDVVDTRASIKQDNVAPSFQKTMEISSISDENGKNSGSEAKSSMPAAKSRFRIALSRPVPSRTAEAAGDAAAGPAKPDASSARPPANNAPTENLKACETAAPKEGSDKNPNQAPNSAPLNAGQVIVVESPAPEDPSSKPKEIRLFGKLFQPERAKENTKVQLNLSQEVNAGPKQNASIAVQDVSGRQQNSVPQEQNVDVGSQNAVQLQSPATFSSPAKEDLKEPKPQEETSKAAAPLENNSVMSFFKTLVAPKSASKSEDEPKNDSEEKSAKENQPTTETKIPEEPTVVTVAVKPEKAAPVKAVKQETTILERAKKEQPLAPSEVQTDGPQKPKESTPRAKLFWKKTAAEPEAPSVEVAPPVQAPAPNKDATKTPEGQKSKKPNLMTFFKQLSGSGDGGYTNAEEINGKDPDQPTLDQTDGSASKKMEKPAAPVPAESQPAAQKGKESSKDKKTAVELSKQRGNKQETKESPETLSSTQQPQPEPQAVQNGEDPTREPVLKRTEKRQSFGSFFKGIGPKRMCDAEVQTEPVSILSAEKSK
ncbi:breast carcinoma-amplified sequence 1 isoform X2 [Rhinatrema bivittatum]|uniref:breast carcinoma-amplified sequence 1 isoform X2 n=1 Tax=Rhinatrema bivittatum TaxID=194408 RepID=UPI00112704D2|nr:breast carcinoma-amplified sequence 1 isoform X2 [Rhinatrema bivittatum]